VGAPVSSLWLPLIFFFFSTFSAAIYVSILKNRLDQTFAPAVSSAALDAGLPKSDLPALLTALSSDAAQVLDSVPGMTSQIAVAVSEAAKTAYSSSSRTVYLASIAFGGVATIAAFFSKGVDDRLTSEVAKKLRRIGPDFNKRSGTHTGE
jgi:hypothetical protein